MSWQRLADHPWREPLEVAADLAVMPELALLYSGRQEPFTGRTSYLFLEPALQATGSFWSDLPAIDKGSGDLPDWVGYLGYGIRDAGEKVRSDPSPIALPGFWLTRYQRLLRFDHEAKRIEEYGRIHATAPLSWPQHSTKPRNSKVRELKSPMSRAQYEQIVRDTVAAIEAGDFYQANITRKFYGGFDEAPDSFALFEKLCAAGPAPYSAYVKHGAQAILSASPECFLTIAEDGTIISRPIKGSIRRGANEAEDSALRKALAQSGKNLAENLMIVDLMRHDLSQVSEVGSVEVAEQSALYSYATIHHLVSTVRARKSSDAGAYDVVRACFPPGSMTGAPKLAVIDWCAKQEKLQRGVYSGAIGWFSGSGRCDLSVVIRTLLIDGRRFEFQVGGGIVAESTPEEEWHETLVKARGIIAALGISEKDLEKL